MFALLDYQIQKAIIEEQDKQSREDQGFAPQQKASSYTATTNSNSMGGSSNDFAQKKARPMSGNSNSRKSAK